MHPGRELKESYDFSRRRKTASCLSTLLRFYGVPTLIIFGALLAGFASQTPLLSDDPKGALNWVIWNGIRCGKEPCYVPPMLFIIHIVWGVFSFLAARRPLAHVSFLTFTGWAYLAHGLIMCPSTDPFRYAVALILDGHPVRVDTCVWDTTGDLRRVSKGIVDVASGMKERSELGQYRAEFSLNRT